MKAIEMFKTTDGQLFDNKEAAEAHESAIQNASRIEAFLNDKYPIVEEGKKQGSARTMAKKAVEAFLAGDY